MSDAGVAKPETRDPTTHAAWKGAYRGRASVSGCRSAATSKRYGQYGLFTSDPFRSAFLAALGADPGVIAYEHKIETTLDALADHLGQSLDLSALLAAARPPRLRRAA